MKDNPDRLELTNEQRAVLNDEQRVAAFVATKRASEFLLRSKPNVIGIGVGLRVTGGRMTSELTVKVYVSRKISKEYLNETQLIPSKVDRSGVSYPIDVEEARVPVAEIFSARTRPVLGGSSVGPVGGLTGTIACCVTRNDGNTYILSNNHVLANVDQLPIGTKILQPGPADGGAAPNDVVGTLFAAVPIDFGSTSITLPFGSFTFPNSNRVDCALAQITGAFNRSNREIEWIGYPAFAATNPPSIFGFFFRPVHKMGRTTEYLVGIILDASFDGFIDYSVSFGNPKGTNLAWFTDQFRIAAPTRSGDSGSLWVDAETNAPIALHFAGDGVNSAFANPVFAVLSALGLTRI